MKKNSIFVAAALMALTSANAFADNQQVRVSGSVAYDLIHNLENAGAQVEVRKDRSVLNIQNMSCSESSFPNRTQCRFRQVVHGPGPSDVVRMEDHQASGLQAIKLIHALEETGVAGKHGIEVKTHRVASIHCEFNSTGPSAIHLEECTLQVNHLFLEQK